ncbi:coiled-coil domain-containing protein [Gilvimarinus japonicus]|uniref:Uncharacterized protein n=1 Tax=Gilvimarinus japonicus TaxID=1796469 RepID=A0ABV7HP67_9GAMM
MENAQTIAQWQELLQNLAPVTGWLYIGAGRGDVLRETRFAKVPRLLAVEAEQHSYQMLAHATAPHRNWQAVHALVNNTYGRATWHQLSREEESGLLPADALSALWPNLNEHQRAEHPAVSLSHLLEQTGESQEHYNWLTIDCLPAVRLLQGLNGALNTLDMIELRVAINNGIASDQTGATLEECDELLLPQGFTRLTLEETNNPLLGRALYGRALERQLTKRQLTEIWKLNAELESQNDALTSQCNKLTVVNETIQNEQETLRCELENQKRRELHTQEKLQQARQDVIALESQNSELIAQHSELKAINDASQNERDCMRNELENHKKQDLQTKEKLQQARQDMITLESQKDELTSQCSEQKAINDAIQKELENTYNELENQKRQEVQTKEKLQQAQAELKEQQRSAQLSTKLLAKVEADASDLRERYAEKTKSEQELKDLIKELHAKLQAASHFYHKLEQEHPEVLEKL